MELTIPVGAIIAAIASGRLAEHLAERQNLPGLVAVAWAHYGVALLASVMTIVLVCMTPAS